MQLIFNLHVQIADKDVSTAKMTKSFGRAFSKARGVEGAQPSSPFAEGEIPFGVSLLLAFLFAPHACKEKSD